MDQTVFLVAVDLSGNVLNGNVKKSGYFPLFQTVDLEEKFCQGTSAVVSVVVLSRLLLQLTVGLVQISSLA